MKNLTKILIILLLTNFNLYSKNRTIINGTQLIDSLKISEKGDSVFIPGNIIINASGKTITVPEGVTLYSNRLNSFPGGGGALIYSTSFTPVDNKTPLIQTGGENVTLSGLRLRGATSEISDFDYRKGVSKGIHGNHKGLKVINCEIFWFDMWGIYLYTPENSFIYKNYIHHCRNAGYGYGVWVGGSGTKYEGTSTIEKNIFDACRSAIDGSGHYNNMIIIDNLFLPEQHYTVISRHGQSNGCFGGNNITIMNNTILSFSKTFTIPTPATDSGKIIIKNNILRTLPCRPGKSISSIECKGDLFCSNDTLYSNNNIPYIPEFSVKITSNKDTLKLGETCTLSAEGGQFYWWKIPDGNLNQLDKVGNKIFYNFTQPGSYIITLYSLKNNKYCISHKNIFVLPKEGTQIIFWVKDSYIGNIKNILKKSFLINDTEYWSDDIEGYEGWQRIIVRYDSTIKKISLQFSCINNSPSEELGEVFCWWDAVSILTPEKVLFSDSFESEKINWQLSTSNLGSNVSTQSPVGEKRDGEKSYLFRKAIGGNIQLGWGGKISWNFK